MRGWQPEAADKIHETEWSVVYRTRASSAGPTGILELLKGVRGRSPSPHRLARFRRTLEILATLRSPHVLAVERVESIADTVAAVFEDFAGRSLGESTGVQGRSVDETLRIAIGLCRALAEIHRAGIVHRDLKPSSVLWDAASGVARLVNFGLASGQELVPRGPQAPRVLEGTLAYMSPEQTGRTNRPVDDRSDLYALGVTLYELFTGKRPFESDDPLEIIHGHVAKPPAAPSSIVASLPLPLSDILLRLLQKDADDRYQSAEGVAADLGECLRQLELGGDAAIHPFLLASQDLAGRFRLPAHLYGREAEVELLVRSFQRVTAGELMFTLVAGHSGVGKSSLVQELYRPLAIARGRYVAGKYDQYQRGVPYSALGAALDALCDQLLCESPDVLEAWRQRILDAVGRSGQALIEVIPALERIIGPQPALPARDARAAQNLFNRVFQDFVEALCRPAEPLVLFLDDLQWADLASLAVLRTVLENPRVRGLHLVGAYRDNEVDASHPLLLLVGVAEKAGVAIAAIHVGNLSLGSVAALVGDTFSLDEPDALDLARIVHAKTDGNAFFTTEFVKALHGDGLVAFDRGRRRWVWDVAEIHGRNITANVVELMAVRIRLLPPSTQRLLRLAACIGGAFDLTTLAIISDGVAHEADVMSCLIAAVELGVIVDLDHASAQAQDAVARSFRFQHDRVQQAAYSLIPEAERRRVHLEIARQLIADAVDHDQADERLFEIVGHLEQGAPLLTDPEERRRTARLHLDAGRKARRASAHHAALDYLRRARALLPDDCFETDYELAFEIKLAMAKCATVAGQFAEADALSPRLFARARTVVDRIRIFTVQAAHYHLRGAYQPAHAGPRPRARSGGAVPATPAALAAASGQELGLVPGNRGERAIAALVDAPAIESAEVRATLQMLVSMWMSAYLVSREDLVQWSSVRLTNLSLRHGTSEQAAFAYVQYAYLCVGRLQRFEEGYAYGQAALELADRHDDVEMRGKIYFLFGIFVSHWTRHVSFATEAMRRGYLYSVEAGDWTYAVYAAANVVSNLLIAGAPCDEVEAEAETYLAFLKDKAPVGLDSFFLPGGYCALLNLQGRTLAPDSFDCELLNERRFHERFGHLPIVEAWFYAVKIRSLFLHRSFDMGVEVIAKADVVAEGVPAQVKVPEAYFYSCLMLAAAQGRIADAAVRAEAWERFRRYEAQLKIWAEHCPDNYDHKYSLVVAERTRVEGGSLETVLAWYDRAIETAEAGQFRNVVAVARELKGRYWLERGQKSYAAIELLEAQRGFQHWGATAKVAMLEREFDELSPRASAGGEYTPAELDLLSALKASRAIAGKLELDELVETMMAIVLESAGADRGVLLRSFDGRWCIEADAAVGQPVRIVPGASGPEPAGPASVPFSVIHYVVRTQAAVMIDDPARDPRFGQDPYVRAVEPRSMLCVPLANQGRTIGVLYLENKLGHGAFLAARSDLVGVLAGQMATSVDNARPLAAHHAVVRRPSNFVAELRVLNTDVISANRELEAFSYSVAHDLRAPLRGMSGFARVLLDDHADKLDAEGRDCLMEIQSGAQKMASLIDALLSFSRLTRSELKPERVDLSALAVTVAAELRGAEPEHAVELVVAEGLWAEVDPRLARLLVENLLGNAWKFTRQRASAKVEVGAADASGARTFFVRDNGAGFDMAYADKLFVPFQRLHTVAEYPGTGIGLATVQRIVFRHGGRCWAEGRVGEGATFFFNLPAVRGAA